MSKINEEIERHHLKQRKLEATFEKKLQENIVHEQTKQQEASLINQLAAIHPPTAPSSFVSGSSNVPMDVDSVSAASPSSTASASVDTPSANVQSNYMERQAKLEALQQMLSQVDQSIAENTDLPWDFDNMFVPTNNQTDFSNFKVCSFLKMGREISRFIICWTFFQFPEETKGMDLTALSPSTGFESAKNVEPCDRRTVVYCKDDKLDIGGRRKSFPEKNFLLYFLFR